MNDPVSWRRLGAGTAATFLVIGAFLAGRGNGGSDPAPGRSSTATTTSSAASGSTRSGGQSAATFSDPNPPTTAAS
ncbi:MAG: hypothetical protein QOG63_2275 [Thermoleophilaceae bacterium]|jgi:hypothetical protein|nr:hypothetical protein [Thermoleophilaceae bacterium]